MTEEIINELRKLGNPANLAGMARYGIATDKALGISMPVLRNFAKGYKKNHELALELWKTGIHDAMLMSTIIDDPKKVTPEQMENWVRDFDSWDVCDQACSNLFARTPYGYDKAMKWCREEPEFVKRAGFALMAYLMVHDKKAPEEKFIPFLDEIIHESTDPRNFVKKAVNWALRTYGKRSRAMYPLAIITAEKIAAVQDKTAKWIAADALRELLAKDKAGQIRG